jgi:hypothetical protein
LLVRHSNGALMAALSMMGKSAQRFSEKIMPKQQSNGRW